MYTTMEYYSDVFPYIYVNMIKVGELSGSLTNSLQQAVEYLDDTAKLTKKIKSILIPNIAQFLLLFVLLIVGYNLCWGYYGARQQQANRRDVSGRIE